MSAYYTCIANSIGRAVREKIKHSIISISSSNQTLIFHDLLKTKYNTYYGARYTSIIFLSPLCVIKQSIKYTMANTCQFIPYTLTPVVLVINYV